MKNFILVLFLIGTSVYALGGVYKSTKYIVCDSKRSLDAWTTFTVDKDFNSRKAYFGKKCFILKQNIKVSGIDTDWGKVSFFYSGVKMWGYVEGIEY